ncbi:hypothetical protein GA0070606_0412 [Micromonospora citrea]|uniref:Uncharacterized protein n=1 Tax=Micromonospora citrea TaxID=47855 RepID=A0A1C6TSH5_9ACTN|nr:hypothetical protein [Micromonospora citrea]SCL44707.1 hypothetical protein GA0070606_0412 [Micromonospora citrea]
MNCWVVYAQDNGDAMGQGTFTARDELLYAQDDAADGRGIHVSATWRAGSTRHQNAITLTSGAGSRKTLDLDIAEATSVTVTVCQTDDGERPHCWTRTARA